MIVDCYLTPFSASQMEFHFSLVIRVCVSYLKFTVTSHSFILNCRTTVICHQQPDNDFTDPRSIMLNVLMVIYWLRRWIQLFTNYFLLN